MGPSDPKSIGRYLLYDEIAAGGMATVHLGRMIGPAGFARTVAIKRLHAQFVKDPDFVAMLLDEARLAARIHHPNVASTLDVVEHGGELFLVMELLRGESLARLTQAAKARGERVPAGIAVAAVVQALHGLHAAHEAKTERGEPLGIVHRDVSPQNIFVGVDGATRVLDFGIAKAANRLQSTRDGQIKGKLRYMAPEQVQRRPVDRRVDVYAAAMVLYETVTGEKLFAADDPGGVVHAILEAEVEPPSQLVPSLAVAIDAVVLRGLARDPAERFATAAEFADAIEDAVRPAKPRQVSAWVEGLAGEALRASEARVAIIESSSDADGGGSAGGPIAPRVAPGSHSESITVPVAAGAFAVKSEGTATDAQLVTDASARTAPRAKGPGSSKRLAFAFASIALASALAVWLAPRFTRTQAGVDAAASPARASAAGATPSQVAAVPPPASATAATEASAPDPRSGSAEARASDTSDAEVPSPRPTTAETAAPHVALRPPSGRPRAAPPGPPAPRAAPKSTRPGCERPYTIVDGIKTWKPECL